MGLVKTVLRFSDGRVIKGFTEGFDPRRTSFRFQETNDALAHEWMEMQLEGLKAVCFVRALAGDSHFGEQGSYDRAGRNWGRRIQVTFRDGEKIMGFAMANDVSRPGFYLFPADLKGNYYGVFVMLDAVHDIWYL